MKDTRKDKQILKQIREALWPAADPDHSWDADTIDSVARIMSESGNDGYGPPAGDENPEGKPSERLGGVYAIEDPELRHEMVRLNTEGERCETTTGFERLLFRGADGPGSGGFDAGNPPEPLPRYLVSFMPASYEHDLSNASGCASPMDAAQAYVSLILEGYSVVVWDRSSDKAHCAEQNEYIYKGLEDLTDPKKVLDAMTDEDRHDLIFKYCSGCGTKDRSCRCWDES